MNQKVKTEKTFCPLGPTPGPVFRRAFARVLISTCHSEHSEESSSICIADVHDRFSLAEDSSLCSE
jgi:hypothetical protein